MENNLENSLGRRALIYVVNKLPDNLFFNTALTFVGISSILGQDLLRQRREKLEDRLGINYDKYSGIRYPLSNFIPYIPALFN